MCRPFGAVCTVCDTLFSVVDPPTRPLDPLGETHGRKINAMCTQNTTLTTLENEVLENANTTSDATPKGVSPRYTDLLACFKYDPNGELPLKGNCLGASEDGKAYYYCEAVEVVITTLDGKTVGLGKNPYEWFCHSVAKKWATHRDWLPDSVLSQTEQNESEVSGTLFECLHDGIALDEIVDKCFKALDKRYESYKQDTHKTEPRCEHEWKAQRAFVATLFTDDLSTVGGVSTDLEPYDGEFVIYDNNTQVATKNVAGLSLSEREQLTRLAKLFNAVKEAHRFATPEKWLCAQCYALNMPTEVAIERVYGEAIKSASGKSQKTLDKAINSCRVKYSHHANEVFGWILDEVEKSPEGLDKWVAVLNRCKATAEATVTLEECAVKFSINDEVVKYLRSKLNALPESVLKYCEAVKSGITA